MEIKTMKIKKHVCPACQGKTTTSYLDLSRRNTIARRKVCATCHGTGKVWPSVIEELEMKEMERKLKQKPPKPKLPWDEDPWENTLGMATKYYVDDEIKTFVDEVINTVVEKGGSK